MIAYGGYFMITVKSNTAILAFVVICCGIIVLDSIVLSLFASTPREPARIVTLLLFEGISAFFIFSSYVFLRSFRQKDDSFLPDRKIFKVSRLLKRIVTLNQLTLCCLVGSIAISVAIFGAFVTQTLLIIIYVSYVGAIGFLLFLSYHLFRWFKSFRNYPILLYGLAFSLIIVGLIMSIAYLTMALSYYDPILKMKRIRAALVTVQSPTSGMSSLSTIYTYLSPIAFVLIWIPTMVQLKKYSTIIGSGKYWVLVAIPLVYYFFPLVADEFGIFDSLRLDYGSQFNLVYAIFFSPYRQVGGLLFGIVFWITALKVKRTDLRLMLQMAGTGMILLFGSTVLHGLSHIVAPPFGIITISFTVLAAYLVTIGLYTSAIILSTDSVVLKDVKKLVKKDASLLHGMGSAELRRELERTVVTVTKKHQEEMAKLSGVSTSINEDDIKQYLDQALREIKEKK
jgi:hypothetical protein